MPCLSLQASAEEHHQAKLQLQAAATTPQRERGEVGGRDGFRLRTDGEA